jgi:HAMP domain-containing protein
MQPGMTRHVRIASVLVFCIAVVAGLVAWHEWTLSRALASRDLHGARTALRAAEAHFARQLIQRGESIAGNQAVTGYIGQALDNTLPGIEPDYTSVVDLLEERRAQMKLGMVAMLDAKGRVLATTDRVSGQRDFGDSAFFRAASRDQASATGLLVDGERAMHVLAMPLARYGFSDVYLMLGEPLGTAFAQTLEDAAGVATALDVVLLASEASGPRVLSSAMPASSIDGLLARWPELQRAGDEGRVIDAAGGNRMALAAPLFGSDRGHVLVLVPADGDARVRSMARWPLLAGAALALLALAVCAWWLVRRVFMPLDDLLRVARYAADTGDLHLKAQVIGTPTIKRLAEAFNRICSRASVSMRD